MNKLLHLLYDGPLGGAAFGMLFGAMLIKALTS